MVTAVVEVKNEHGLHMRIAGVLANEMKKFSGCSVTLKAAEKTAKATSVMQLMAACIKQGETVEICAEGENEQAALDRAVELFETCFGE